MRDPRAFKILTARYRVQAWFTLGPNEWPLVSFFDKDLVQTTIDLEEGSDRKTALLVEFNSGVASLEDDWSDDQEKLRNVAARLRFSWLGLPVMICARLVDTSARESEKVRAKICHPAAVGGPTPTMRGPGLGYGLFHSALLTKPCRPEIDRAIRWYLAGLDAPDPFAEAVCLWTAVEALAPVVEKPPRCGRCDCELPACPACKTQTPGPAVLQSVRKYLADQLGAEGKNVRAMYKFRSKLIHGEQDRTYVQYPDAASHVASLRPIVERLLCKELGVPNDRPFFVAHQEHDAIMFDAIVSCPWRERVYELPGPLFKDLKLTIVVPDAGGAPPEPDG